MINQVYSYVYGEFMPLILSYAELKALTISRDPTRNIPCVYKYYVPDECMYIGLTTIGIRARHNGHMYNDTFDTVVHYRGFTLNDLIIVVHRCKDKQTMQYLEKKLVRYYQPRCNFYFRSAISHARKIFYPPRSCTIPKN